MFEDWGQVVWGELSKGRVVQILTTHSGKLCKINTTNSMKFLDFEQSCKNWLSFSLCNWSFRGWTGLKLHLFSHLSNSINNPKTSQVDFSYLMLSLDSNCTSSLNLTQGFIKGQALGKLTGCERDLAIDLPGRFHLRFLHSFIRKNKTARLKTPTDLLHKNLMKSLLTCTCTSYTVIYISQLLLYLCTIVAVEGKFNNEYTFWRKQNVPCGVDFWCGLSSNTGITWIQEKDNRNTEVRWIQSTV